MSTSPLLFDTRTFDTRKTKIEKKLVAKKKPEAIRATPGGFEVMKGKAPVKTAAPYCSPLTVQNYDC